MPGVLFRTGHIPDDIDDRDHPLFSADTVQGLIAGDDDAAEAIVDGDDDRGNGVSNGPQQSKILSDLPPVYKQGDIGSCTANSVAAALRYAHFQYKKTSTPEKYEDFDPSRLFLYFNSRITVDPMKLEKNPTAPISWDELGDAVLRDTGSSTRIAISTLRKYGICKEKLWAYGEPHSADEAPSGEDPLFVNADGSPLEQPPPANPIGTEDIVGAYKQAKDYFHVLHPDEPVKDMIPPAISYYRIFDPAAVGDVWEKYNAPPIALLEQCILDGYPFVFGMDLYENGHDLLENSWDSNGFLKKHTSSENMEKRDGHALMAVGFDRSKQAFFVQNSWGTGWPKKVGGPDLHGYCWIPYDYFDPKKKVITRGIDPKTNKPRERNLTRDFWVIKV